MSENTDRTRVASSLAKAPIIGVVRTDSKQEAARQARLFIAGGLQLIEITFSVPEATTLVRELLDERGDAGPPWIGMGTVTDAARATAAVEAGTEFIVSPNTSPERRPGGPSSRDLPGLGSPDLYRDR